MLRPKTYREKNKLLLIGFICLLLFSYFSSLSKTVGLYGDNTFLASQLDSVQHAPAAINRLTAQLTHYEKSLDDYSMLGKDWEERLLQGVAKVCQQHHVTVINFPAPQLERQNDYAVLNREIKMEGGYHNLLRVLYALEQLKALGKITSVRYVTEEDRNTKKIALFAYIYVQHIEKEVNHAL